MKTQNFERPQNAQHAFSLGYAPFQQIEVLHNDGKVCGIRPAGRYNHHKFGTEFIVAGVLYHRPDGRIGAV